MLCKDPRSWFAQSPKVFSVGDLLVYSLNFTLYVPQEEPEFLSMLLIVTSVAGITCIIHLIIRKEKRAVLGKRQWLACSPFGQMNTKCWLSFACLPWLWSYLFRVAAWQPQYEVLSLRCEERLPSWAPWDPEVVWWPQLPWGFLDGNPSRESRNALGASTWPFATLSSRAVGCFLSVNWHL